MLTSNITWQLAYYSLQYWTTWMLWHQLQRNSNCPSWLSLCSSSHTHTHSLLQILPIWYKQWLHVGVICGYTLFAEVWRTFGGWRRKKQHLHIQAHTHTQYIKYIKTTCSDVPTTNAEISITNVGPVYRPTQYTKECFKFLDFPLADFCTSENVINFMDRNNHRWAAIGWRNTLRWGVLHATSQLPCKIHQVPACEHIILFKRINLWQYFVCLHERTFFVQHINAPA